MSIPKLQRAVLLDRDGTILVEREYLAHPDGVALLPHAAEGLRRMQSLGLLLVVITNQSGVGRGFFGLAQVDAVNLRMSDLLAAKQIVLSGIYICPHRPDEGCLCRKPAPKLALDAARDLGIDLAASFVIGDKPSDIALGAAIGATSILVTTGHGADYFDTLNENFKLHPFLAAQNLEDAVLLIQKLTPSVEKEPSPL